MNKAKGNMYDFVTHTWNPVKGRCPHGCSYCYMAKFYNRLKIRPGDPYLDAGELSRNLGSGNYVFAGSAIDVFAGELPDRWITDMVNAANSYPFNTYLWHTKNPEKAVRLLPAQDNFILCTTLESSYVPGEMRGSAPAIAGRVFPRDHPLRGKYLEMRRMVTAEPVTDFNLPAFLALIRGCKPEQVNIGADTGGNRLPEPPAKKLRRLVTELEKFTAVRLKKNLKRLLRASPGS